MTTTDKTLQTAIDKLVQLQRTMAAYSHATSMIYFDSVTAAPSDTAAGRGMTYEILSPISYNLLACQDTGDLLKFLRENAEALDEQKRREVDQLTRSRDIISKIPQDEYVKYDLLINEAESVWHKAKAANDFPAFAPYLEKIFDSTIKFAGYSEPDKDPYDVLLDRYERGLDRKTCDVFFERLRKDLVPLIHKIGNAKQPDDSFIKGYFPIAKQRELSDYVMQVMSIDRSHCNIGETEHPFSINFNNKDVRITTKYFEDDFTNSLYSVIHEAGHALYDLGIADKLQYTCLSGGTSMGIHESQSRLFENNLGRSRAFLRLLMPKFVELFPELSGVTAEQMYRAVNKSCPSLIRIEADELTYSLHIMVRYEIENMLLHKEIAVADLPKVWAEKVQTYLGIEVPDDKRGVLQDTHWADGLIGYFPSYAIGSAYSAQMMHTMKQDLDPEKVIETGTLKPIVDWLGQRVHQYGSLYDPAVVLKKCTGENFDPKYYTDYLNAKFSDLYNL